MEFGLYGLGVMGASLGQNLIRHGISTALYSKSAVERSRFQSDVPAKNWVMTDSVSTFLQTLERPRRIFLMITAGNPVDEVLSELLPLLDEHDIIMDGGNAHFEDTNRRCRLAAEQGVFFLGVGVSGGQKGAYNGPCMMVGGALEAWNQVSPYLCAIAAHPSNQTVCCGYIGSAGSGHYVKMVHNGIEYALMQQISDCYALMRDGFGMDATAIADTFRRWNCGSLESYLLTITEAIFRKQDSDGTPLVNHVQDVAHQKGTGNWTVLDAAKQGVYIPCIDAAMFTRCFSDRLALRTAGAASLLRSPLPCAPLSLEQLRDALHLSMLCAYAQGLSLIERTSTAFAWHIDLSALVELWEGGCIIQGALLPTLADALNHCSGEQLLLSPALNAVSLEPALRSAAALGVCSGVPIPALSAALLYYDMIAAGQLSLNLIQAQRDCFGAHTYERTDRDGVFHSDWLSPLPG